MQVNMHEAKTRLSQLVERASRGERVIIARAGQPAVELVPVRSAGRKRQPGRLSGRISMAADFDSTPAEVIAGFEGKE